MKYKIVNKTNGKECLEEFFTEYSAKQALAEKAKIDNEFTKKHFISVPYHYQWMYSFWNNEYIWMEKPCSKEQ